MIRLLSGDAGSRRTTACRVDGGLRVQVHLRGNGLAGGRLGLNVCRLCSFRRT
ncbi:MAG: hypothetical protein AB9879_01080 [Methanothrix sp.]